MCGAVRASPLLRSLPICQVACRLEWCIAAKTPRGNQQWNSTPSGKGPRCRRASLGDLKIKVSFPQEKSLSTPQSQTKDRFVLFLHNRFIQRSSHTCLFVCFLNIKEKQCLLIPQFCRKCYFCVCSNCYLLSENGLNYLKQHPLCAAGNQKL